MRKLIGLLKPAAILIVSALMLGCGGSSSINNDDDLGSVTMNLDLSSTFTVPNVSGDGTGTASVTLNRDTGDLSGSVSVSNLTGAVTAAHIHDGIAGKAGGVIVTLEQDSASANQWNVPADEVLTATQMDALLSAQYYINVHTAANASGEVRGQIVPAGYEVIRVLLKGENQVPDEVTTSNSGIGYVTVNTSTGAISGNITNTGLDDATAAHVHSGFAGTNGGVVVGLESNADDDAVWDIPAGTVLETAELAELMAGGNYFNVHTPANASGEVRGQIAPEDIEVVRENLSGDFEVPPVMSAGSGVGYITVNETTSSVVVHAIADGLSDTTAAHIHSGFAGTIGGVVIPLTQDPNESRRWSSADGETLDATGMSDFESGKLYFNIHTTSNASGEIRGQISHGSISVTRNVLDGSQEVPPVTTTSASGIGYTTVDEDTGAIEANVSVTGVTATAAHIHEGAAGSNGGIALGLVVDVTDADFFSASGTLTADQITAFKADELYFNVHSAANPAGEIRAQITR